MFKKIRFDFFTGVFVACQEIQTVSEECYRIYGKTTKSDWSLTEREKDS